MKGTNPILKDGGLRSSEGSNGINGITFPSVVYAYDIEGPMQGICLKVIVPIGE